MPNFIRCSNPFGTAPRDYTPELDDITGYLDLKYMDETWKKYDVACNAREYIWPSFGGHDAEGVRRLEKYEGIMREGFPKGKGGLELNIFHQKMDSLLAQVLAPTIVGGDWTEYSEAICKKRGWTGNYRTGAACAPRQFGKSTVICKSTIAFAETMPGGVQSIFSTGKRASNHDLQVMYKFVCMRGLQDQVVAYNQEQLWIRFGPAGDPQTRISKMSAFPSNPTISIFFYVSFLFFLWGARTLQEMFFVFVFF